MWKVNIQILELQCGHTKMFQKSHGKLSSFAKYGNLRERTMEKFLQ
ncbi:hypothetical protein P4315_28900 [Bacillus thuringiensis]|nr:MULTISPECIES: hypothetical protein [Bacillus]MDA2417928.1 hypothetical protein [Bacillus cereus]EEM99225.1 hypothetical protein bthur0014_61480 [Bacillus thuringiensis IBL 4222]MCC4031555.1 hypothetical protein [Bacillus thuringiensis]MEB4826510.1 hypothetical protein [Bacillus thuringiensis]MEC2590543.1 hypothetical protein [Bacillus thuringiensis]